MSKFYSIDKENTTDVWLTDPDLVKSLGHFDLDPCSPNNLKWKLADRFYSLENNEDGLALSWDGYRCWINPPYSNWVPFVKKASEHNNSVVLIFARTETAGFHNWVWPKADSILFIKRRLKFLRPDGSKGGSSTAPSVLIAYGKNNTLALLNSGIEGKLVQL